MHPPSEDWRREQAEREVRGGPWSRRRGCEPAELENPVSGPDNRNMAGDKSLRDSILITAGFVGVLWFIHILEFVFGLELWRLGVYPRHIQGMWGLVTGPLIHGSWSHLISNTLPTLLLGTMLIYGYPRSRWWVLACIWLLSGLGVWLFARGSFHFGASGLTHGMFFFLFTAGVLRRDKRSAALLMVAFYMYCGMVLSIFPGDPGISFEYHACGALAGSVCGFLFRDWDPAPQRRRYSWEEEDDNAEDPVIGDQWK